MRRAAAIRAFLEESGEREVVVVRFNDDLRAICDCQQVADVLACVTAQRTRCGKLQSTGKLGFDADEPTPWQLKILWTPGISDNYERHAVLMSADRDPLKDRIRRIDGCYDNRGSHEQARRLPSERIQHDGEGCHRRLLRCRRIGADAGQIKEMHLESEH